ncbi:MAG: methyl-accepting chemotaxis protein [Sulfurospirillum sp.]
MNIKKYKLSTMFSIMFALAFIIISTVFYYFSYTKQATSLKTNLKSQARSILDFADVLLDSRNEKFFSGESSEVPQIIQNSVFDKFTKISGGKVFFKEASKSPTNAKNLATKYEALTIDQFAENRKLKEIAKTVKIEGKEYYMLSRPIIAEKRCKMCHPAWKSGDVIAIEDVKIDMKDFYSALKNSLFITMLTGLINIVIILLLIQFIFKRYVSNRINKLLQVIFRVEKGNFVIDDLLENESLKQGSTNNEIDRLFRHLKRMVNALKPVISNVIEASKHMAFQSSYSYTKIDETNQQVQHQNGLLVNSKDLLNSALNENSQMKQSLDSLLDSSRLSQKIVQQSKEDIENNLKKGEEAVESMDNTSQTISDLKIFSNEVSKMTSVITDIADETNLIALNAAIEAARAGEHGRSFSVVADKIRELAEVSLKNASDISIVLKKIDQKIDNVSKSAGNSKNSVLNLVENSQQINNSFEKINESFRLISDSLLEFDSDFTKESKMLRDTDSNLNEVKKSSAVLTDNAEETKKIMDSISHKSAQLKTLADGFEVVLNNRTEKRTVQTPPLKAKDEKGRDVFVFDLSTNGVSFYFLNTQDSLNKGERITLYLQDKHKNSQIIKCEIIYLNNKNSANVYFYGARKI